MENKKKVKKNNLNNKSINTINSYSIADSTKVEVRYNLDKRNNTSNNSRNSKKKRESIWDEKRNIITQNSFFREILSYILIVFIAIVSGYAISAFVIQSVDVVGPSMNPVLTDNETVMVNKFEYKIRDIKRYDIIAYSKVDSDEYYDIKRVIALPGESVQIKDGNIIVDGNVLADCPIKDKILNQGIAGEEIKLGKNEYFVLGDNINNSEDSRYSNVGNVSESEILGKVTRVISPKNKRGKVQ